MRYRDIKRAVYSELVTELELYRSAVDHAEHSSGDAARWRKAYAEIRDEMRRRATGERKPPSAPRVNPDQLSLLEGQS